MSIVNFLKNFIRVEFSYESGASVSSITANLRKTVTRLEAHAADQIKKGIAKTEQAAKLLKQRAAHEEEHIAASKAAQNIKALLG